MTRFVLASASPRRRELLLRVGLEPEVVPSSIDETVGPGEAPLSYVRRMAVQKATACSDASAALAADTVVALDGEVLSKPSSSEDAKEILGKLSGRWHVVHTAVAVRDADGACSSTVVSTRVRFRQLSAAEIDAYVASGEADDKAGAYGIQGLGGVLVAQVEGSYSNVVGLPVEETLALLEAQDLR